MPKLNFVFGIGMETINLLDKNRKRKRSKNIRGSTLNGKKKKERRNKKGRKERKKEQKKGKQKRKKKRNNHNSLVVNIICNVK